MAQNQQPVINKSPRNKILYQSTELALASAARLISAMRSTEVRLLLDSISVTSKDNRANIFSPTEPDLIAINHGLESNPQGSIVFLIDQTNGFNFIRNLLDEVDLSREMSEMEEDALTEIGNIIVNNCLSNYVQILHRSFASLTHTLVPTLIRGHYVQLMEELIGDTKQEDIFMVKIEVEVARIKFYAYILWIDIPVQLISIPTDSTLLPEITG